MFKKVVPVLLRLRVNVNADHHQLEGYFEETSRIDLRRLFIGSGGIMPLIITEAFEKNGLLTKIWGI